MTSRNVTSNPPILMTAQARSLRRNEHKMANQSVSEESQIASDGKKSRTLYKPKAEFGAAYHLEERDFTAKRGFSLKSKRQSNHTNDSLFQDASIKKKIQSSVQKIENSASGSGRDFSQLNNPKTSSNVTSNPSGENQGMANLSGLGSKMSKKSSAVYSLNRHGQLASNNSGISDKSHPLYSHMPPPNGLA